MTTHERTCGHPEAVPGRGLEAAPTGWVTSPPARMVGCPCGRNLICPLCGFGWFTLPHECPPPVPPGGEGGDGDA
jgi:hypothetical protein